MDLPKSGDATSRFLAFVEGLTSVIGHADRAKPLRDYCIGLMMPGERKSVEPMAAITAPERTAAQLSRCYILLVKAPGLTRRYWPRSAKWYCRR
jgi:SRSO17 transposase